MESKYNTKKFQLNTPTKVIFGQGEFDNIKEYIDEVFQDKRNILLVTGKEAMKKLGYTGKLINSLKDYNVSVFNQVEPNPSIETVEHGRKFARQKNTELIIALGGGSAIDAAKAIALMITNEGKIDEYLPKSGKTKGRKIEHKALPLIAIPTTSGTGSEVTWASVLTQKWEDGIRRKSSIRDPSIYPILAIIDPELTLELPEKITASSGIDALTHAIESYLSIDNPNPLSEMCSLYAIKLIFNNLEKTVHYPKDAKARENMAKASLFAGYAFTNTGTIGSHSISCPLTTIYNINHGHACGLTLPAFLTIYSEKSEEHKKRISEIGKIIGSNTVEEFSNKIKDLMNLIGLETRLNNLNIPKKDKEKIIKESIGHITGRDPIEITPKILQEVIEKTF